jgi:hypothetical protein
MTAEPDPAPKVDRHQAVFRSAERLAASMPVRRRRRLGPRGVFFIIGLLCGLWLALLLIPRFREAALTSLAGLRGDEAGKGGAERSHYRDLRFAQSEVKSGVASPASAPDAAAVATPTPSSDTGAAPAASSAVSNATPAQPKSIVASRIAVPAMVALEKLPPWLRLTGTLRDTDRAFADVEFDLQLRFRRGSAEYTGEVRTPGYIARTTPLAVSGLVSPTAITLVAPTDATASLLRPYVFVIRPAVDG